MKSALRKNAVKEIFKTKSRFLSIFCIVAIGVAFFAGVKVASPDMKRSADSYFKNENLAHFRLVSTMGFSDNDIAALEAEEGLTVYAGYFTDVLIDSDENETTARIMSLSDYEKSNEVNILTITEGRFPAAADECIVDNGGFTGGRSIGDRIKLISGTEEELSDTLAVDEYTVVGTFSSPMYIDKTSRGSTTVGNGTLNSVIYVPEENFKTEVYTEIYITVDRLKAESAYNDSYDDIQEAVADRLEQIADVREEERLEEIVSDANDEIDDAQKELDDAKADADKELSDAEKELADAKAEIEDGEKELADGKQQLADSLVQLQDSRKELDDGWAAYNDGVKELQTQTENAKAEIEEQRKALDEAEKEYNDGYSAYQQGLSAYNDGKAQYDEALAQWEQGSAYYGLLAEFYGGDMTALYALAAAAGIELPQPDQSGALPPEAQAFISSLPSEEETAAMTAQLEASKAQLDETEQTLAASKEQLDSTEAQLEAAKAQIDDGRAMLEQGERTLEQSAADGEKALAESLEQLEDGERQYSEGVSAYEEAEAELAEAEQTLADGKKEYEDGLKEYEEAKADADKEIADAEAEIEDARQELADLEPPEWYVFDRSGNPGYSEYGQNAERINNIASVFPVFFILVAALVCLTTMTRMVEEQRSQIGTLKALGYTNGQVIYKYMFYALFATIAGALAGAVVGQKLFPIVIIKAYGMIYTIPDVIVPTDWLLTSVCTAVAAAAAAAAVYLCCKSELSECPAQLMRPKAPKAGKKIFLDRLPVWRKVSFNGKVTARNLFRYKRRMFMTVVGIAGCTALTLTGFGLKDSIGDIVEKQFTQLNFYDGILAFDSDEEKIGGVLEEYGAQSTVYYQKSMTVSSGGKTVSAYLVVPRDTADFAGYYLFRDRKTHEVYPLTSEGVLLDEKTSLLLGLERDGEIGLYEDETDVKNVTAKAFIENYPSHYIYMTEELYVKLFGEVPEYNMMAFKGDLDTDEKRDELAAELLDTGSVLTVSYKNSLMNTMNNILTALNSVVAVLIVSAGALAFVVLYNLTNINITERIREIATLKVMGFYDTEVDGYIFRENLLLTLMGIAAGLFGGTFLAMFIIQTAEIDLVMFGREIKVSSYLLSAAMTLLFSIVVALYMHRRLKKIDMIEALKSVE